MDNARRARPGGIILWIVAITFVFAAPLLVPGIFLLVQRETGTPARVKVDDCETTGSGKFERTYCTGAWIVGGSLLDGGHVVVGPIEGTEQSDAGKTLDVRLHGDTAYSRSLATPLILIGFGLCPIALALLLVFRLVSPN